MIAAAVMMLAAAMAAGWLHIRLAQSRWARLSWRYFSGHALDGRHRTNATWLSPSTETLYPTRVVAWHHLPRLYRAAIRTAGTVAPFAAVAAYRAYPVPALAAISGLLAASAAGGAFLGWRKVRHIRHEWRYVRPLRRTLTPILEGSPARLQIAPDRTEAKIWLPPEFVGTDKHWGLIGAAVTAKTGIESPERTVQMVGSRPYVVYTKSEPPPGKVTSADIGPAIARAAEHEIILGIGKKDQVIDLSLDTEVPHVGFSMETGGGKSKAAMNFAAQVLHHGGLVVVLDGKLISHMWARGLPNVAYAGTPRELHEMLCWLGDDTITPDGVVVTDSELGRRKKVALAAADIRGNILADIGPRIVVICEELNDTQRTLKKYWRAIGGKGPSPASEALESIHCVGRQLRIHAVDIGQRLSARATSAGNSGDARESIGAFLFFNPTVSTWKMLCDGHVQPPASSHKGRFHLVTRQTVRELQGALWDEQDARDFATSGVVAAPRHDMPLVVRLPARQPVAAGAGHALALRNDPCDQAFVVGQGPAGPSSVPGAVTLREAYEAGIFVSLGAARKAAGRAGLIAAGERGPARLYAVDDLLNCQKGQR